MTRADPVLPTNANSTTAQAVRCGLSNVMDTSHTYALVNPQSKLALSDVGGYSQGANVALMPLQQDANSQQWSFMPDSTGALRMVNVMATQELGLPGEVAGNVFLWNDNNTPDHAWTIVATGNPNNCTVHVLNNHISQYLGVSQAHNVSGAPVGTALANDSNFDTTWQLVTMGTAYAAPAVVSTDMGVSDPSLIKIGAGYVLFSSGQQIVMQQSSDRSTFKYVGQALPSMPAWVTTQLGAGASLAEPSVSLVNGAYYLYYTAHDTNFVNVAVGLAISKTGAAGSFVDQGLVLSSGSAAARAPSLFLADDGNYWLFAGYNAGGVGAFSINGATGSYTGTYRYYGTRLDSAAGSFFRHNNYTYMFETYDDCCEGAQSTQHIVVSRANSFYDTFADRGGADQFGQGGTIILATHGSVIAPGRPSVFSDTDGDYLVYYYYDASAGALPKLGINLIDWTGDWPAVK